MRIALSVERFLPEAYGGGQTYVLRLAQALGDRGHTVTVITDSREARTSGGGLRRYSYEGVDVVAVRLPSLEWVEAQAGMGDALVGVFEPAVRDLDPDLVHLNGHKVALARVCRDLGIPYVVTAHHPGIVCPAGTLLDDRESLCKLKAGPGVCVRCCCTQRAGSAASGRVLASVPKTVSRVAKKWADAPGTVGFVARALTFPLAVRASLEAKTELHRPSSSWVAPSRAIADYLVLNGVERSRVAVVPHGIFPLNRTALQPFYGRHVRFGYFGTLNRPKGIHILLGAFGALPRDVLAELHIFGAAQHPWESEAFEGWLACCPRKDDVRLHGRIAPEGLGRAYASIDVLVLPSICLEVFGLVILESFSAGRPVIVTESGGPEELVRHGVDGLIIRRDDAAALAGALATVASDPRQILGLAEGIRPVRTVAQHVDELVPIYEQAIRERPQKPSGVTDGAPAQTMG